MSGCISVLHYDVPITEEEGKRKLRELFEKNKHVSDIRSIDLLVVKVSLKLETLAPPKNVLWGYVKWEICIQNILYKTSFCLWNFTKLLARFMPDYKRFFINPLRPLLMNQATSSEWFFFAVCPVLYKRDWSWGGECKLRRSFRQRYFYLIFSLDNWDLANLCAFLLIANVLYFVAFFTGPDGASGNNKHLEAENTPYGLFQRHSAT